MGKRGLFGLNQSDAGIRVERKNDLRQIAGNDTGTHQKQIGSPQGSIRKVCHIVHPTTCEPP